MKAFPWLLRREIWEHRNVYIVPLVFVSVLVLAYTAILFWGDNVFDDGHVSLRELIEQHPDAIQLKLAAGGLPFMLPAVLLSTVMLFVLFFYLTDSLYAERRDRSVLFWKSLPVADATTVVSKLVTAMAVIPAFTLAGIVIAALLITLANTVFVWTIGGSAWELIWSQIPLVSAPLTMLYALAVESLWYAPLFGWLLLASAWARRAPALWALLPPAGIVFLEFTVLRSSYFLELLAKRLNPVIPTAFRDEDKALIIHDIHRGDGEIDWGEAFGSLIDPQSFLADPGMWGGLIAAAVFVGAAVWLRRYRDAF